MADFTTSFCSEGLPSFLRNRQVCCKQLRRDGNTFFAAGQMKSSTVGLIFTQPVALRFPSLTSRIYFLLNSSSLLFLSPIQPKVLIRLPFQMPAAPWLLLQGIILPVRVCRSPWHFEAQRPELPLLGHTLGSGSSRSERTPAGRIAGHSSWFFLFQGNISLECSFPL